jgi:hypothetical protein
VTVTASSRACVSVDRSQRRRRSCACLQRGLTIYHAEGERESLPDKVGDIEGRMVFDRVSDALESYAERTAPASVRRRRNRRFEAQTPCPRRNTRRRERARAKRGSTKSFAGNEPSQPPRLPQFSTRSRGDFENHFGGHQAMRRREVGRHAAASWLVRNALASSSFYSFSRLLSSAFTVAAITRHAFELFTDECDNAGSGDWVWQWVRFAKK